MIIVTGANGQLGSRIVERLLTRRSADQIGVTVRDTAKASSLAARGVRVRPADFTNPASLATAFEGADQVLVVSASLRGDEAVRANIAAIDAAAEQGARRILYTSHRAASTTSQCTPQLTHAATEQHLEQLDRPFVALRNGFYANTIGYYIGAALETGRLALPADGPVSWTAHDDLAEAAAVALTDEHVVHGISAPLTAREPLDFAAVATMLTDIAGRPVERVVVADDEWADAAVERGMPADAAEFTLGLFRAARAGEFAVTDPLLETIIGHTPITVRSFLEHAVRGASAG